MGCNVVTASADTLDNAIAMQRKAGVNFPVAYGVTQADAAVMGSWWSDDRGGFIQPTEFILGRGGVVLGSLYASGPIGRMSADESLYLITNRERRR